MAELTTEDMSYIVSRIPSDVRKLMREEGTILAGGFIRSLVAREKASDIDLFGPDKETLERWAKDLALGRKGRVHTTDNAFTVLAPPRLPVQFIHRWVYPVFMDGDIVGVDIRPKDDPHFSINRQEPSVAILERIIKDFDFSIAQTAIAWSHGVDGTEGTEEEPCTGYYTSCISDRFYADLAGKRLVYLFPDRNEDAGGSLMRVRKFIEKGYRISALNLGGVIARLVMRVDFGRIERHRGDDHERELYLGQVLTGLLREVDPLHVVDGVELVGEPDPNKDAEWRDALKYNVPGVEVDNADD